MTAENIPAFQRRVNVVKYFSGSAATAEFGNCRNNDPGFLPSLRNEDGAR